MGKLCEWSGCEEEIPVWKNYCKKHEELVKGEENMNPQNQQQNMQMQQQPMAGNMPQYQNFGNQQQQQQNIGRQNLSPLPQFNHSSDNDEQQDVFEDVQKRVEYLSNQQLPIVQEQIRLEIKRIAFNKAIDLLIAVNQQDLAEKQFAEIITDIDTLTSMFYRIIVLKTENDVR